MPNISLTDFVDFVSKSGTPKSTHVRKVKNRGDYKPYQDYYKQIREAIIGMHEQNQDVSVLENIITRVNAKKQANYLNVINGYKKWIKNQSFGWFEPPKSDFELSETTIRINPELGLIANGSKKTVIKLYFKAEPISKYRIDIITHLMQNSIGGDYEMAVLDCQNAKLIKASKSNVELGAHIIGEIAYLEALWVNL